MNYQSTRNDACIVSAAEAILHGLALDGGLYTMRTLTQLNFNWKETLKKDTFGMAVDILTALLPDFGREEMTALVEAAYSGKFESDDLTPSVPLGDDTVLELFRGPTSAFKDVALSMLPHLITAAKEKCGVSDEILILTATSGDTGKAAMEGFRDVDGTKIIVFYPHGGVSAVQQAQMCTQEGSNVCVAAVEGNFDDAQTGVKKIFAAVNEGELLIGKGVRLSSANSINIGRLAPQVVYYFRAYADLLAKGVIRLGERVDFSVPTGNFGDILAGWFAKEMGLPVGRLICASNANDVLTEFINTGRYDRRREFYKTISPSMDILVSSNLERLLYLMSGDAQLVKKLMDELSENGCYEIPEELHRRLSTEFWAGCCNDTATKGAIRQIWNEFHYLADTHTAVAWNVAQQYKAFTGSQRPVVILSTASPYKFPAAVLEALGEDAQGDEFSVMEQLNRLTGVPVPKNLEGLKEKQVRHSTILGKNELLSFVLGKAGERGW
ncbi:MAG: threonine synthase [Oscillospiraceae bacterium]|nr:threonine synthase [Oscillospiraceae bacterium]